MFYGWYIVDASVLIRTVIGVVGAYGFTALVNPMATTLGFSYAQISLAHSLRGLQGGFLRPFTGIAVDRWPAKWLVLIGVIIIGLGYLCLSQVTNLTMFYISFVIIALGSALGVSMAPMTTTARWFRRNLGKASGLLALGAGFGGLLVPVLVKIIDAYGWRTLVIIIAAAIWIVGIPLSFVFRSRPEDYGLLPDGKPQDDSQVLLSPKTYDFSIGIKEAVKMRAFWHLNLATMLQMAACFAVVIHMMPYLISLGIEKSTASMVVMFTTLVSLPARFGFGWLADIFKKKYILAVSVALTSVGVLLFSLINSDSFGSIVAFVIVFALSVGGIQPVRAPIIREYFGTKNFGTILGLTGIFMTIGTAVGPPVAGWMFDTRGVYDPIWLILSGVSMIGVFLMLTIPPAPSPSGNLPATDEAPNL